MKIRAVAILMAALLSLSGCTDRPAAERPTRTVRDMQQNRVEIPVSVGRVVTATYPIATQLVYLVGAREALVGISDYDVNGVMQKIWPEISSIPRAGTAAHAEIAVEELIRLAPDVVFTHLRSPGKDNLQAAGIPGVCLVLESPEALMQGILLVGEIMNRRERAEAIVKYYREKLDYIRERTAHIQPRKRVYFAGPNALTTAGGDFFQHFIIEAAGAENVAAANRGGWSAISMEQLLEWNPDFIFIGRYGTARVEAFTKDERLKDLAAVKNGQVFMARYYIGSWDVPTPESLLGIMWLANKLYPEAVAFDMASEMREFYERCYGYVPDQADIAEVLTAP